MQDFVHQSSANQKTTNKSRIFAKIVETVVEEVVAATWFGSRVYLEGQRDLVSSIIARRIGITV